MQIFVLDDDNLIISYRIKNPDGITLDFSHEIYRYNISEKTTTKLYTEKFEDNYNGIISNNMTLIKSTDGKFALCFSGRYYIFSGDTLVKTGSVDVPGKIVRDMVMSPDLSCYAFRARNPGTMFGYGKYYVADTETGEKRFDDYFWAYDVVFSPDGSKIAFAYYNDDRSITYLGIINPVTGYQNKIKLNTDQKHDYYFFGFTWSEDGQSVRYFNKISQTDEYMMSEIFGVDVNRVNLSDGSITTEFTVTDPEAEIGGDSFINEFPAFYGDNIFVKWVPTEENRNIQFYQLTENGVELIFKYPYGELSRNRYDEIKALSNGRYIMLCSAADYITDATINQRYQIIVYK